MAISVPSRSFLNRIGRTVRRVEAMTESRIPRRDTHGSTGNAVIHRMKVTGFHAPTGTGPDGVIHRDEWLECKAMNLDDSTRGGTIKVALPPLTRRPKEWYVDSGTIVYHRGPINLPANEYEEYEYTGSQRRYVYKREGSATPRADFLANITGSMCSVELIKPHYFENDQGEENGDEIRAVRMIRGGTGIRYEEDAKLMSVLWEDLRCRDWCELVEERVVIE